MIVNQINKQIVLNAEKGILSLGEFTKDEVVFSYVVSKLDNDKWMVSYIVDNPPEEDIDHMSTFQIRFFGTRATKEFIEEFMSDIIPVHQDAWELYYQDTDYAN